MHVCSNGREKLRPFEQWIKPSLEKGIRVFSYVAIRADEEYREGYTSKHEDLAVRLPFKDAGIDKSGVGFIVTSMSLPSRSVVRFYNKRGTAEQWIKEGKQATHWTRLSCHRFRANEVRLQLSVRAYNLGNLWRRLGLPNRIKSWSLTSLQHRLMKTGGRLVKHARYYWLLPAEGHLNRKLFGQMLGRLVALPVPGG